VGRPQCRDMNILRRMKKVELLLAAAGGVVEGHHKLHNLAYLCQEGGTYLGQDFTYYLHGVFSRTLNYDLERAKKWGSLEILRGNPTNYRLVKNVLSQDDRNLLQKEEGFVMVSKISNSSSRVLNLLSTVVYLDSVGYGVGKIPYKLVELRGLLGEQKGEVLRLSQEHFSILLDQSEMT
jgi:uncharacterized protein YwgA